MPTDHCSCWTTELVETHCAYCRKRVPDDALGAVIFCSPRCYGLGTTDERTDR